MAAATASNTAKTKIGTKTRPGMRGGSSGRATSEGGMEPKHNGPPEPLKAALLSRNGEKTKRTVATPRSVSMNAVLSSYLWPWLRAFFPLRPSAFFGALAFFGVAFFGAFFSALAGVFAGAAAGAAAG